MSQSVRQKDIVTRKTSEYLKASTKDYAKYLEGSPTYITYYQLDSLASTQDTSLENVHSLTGKNSPNKYKKITDLIVYGVDQMDIQNDLNEKGLESLINGELIILPNSIKPNVGDFFVFDYPGLTEHMFRIDDVQFDKASPEKYYKVGYSLYQEEHDMILDNLAGDFTIDYDNSSGELSGVITTEDAALATGVRNLVDGLIDKYISIYYNEDMDLFLYKHRDPEEHFEIWFPYLQRFMWKNQVMKRYRKELLEEIYVREISEDTNPQFMSDYSYEESLFRKVELQEPLDIKDSLMFVSNYNLKDTRNLQFFHSDKEYRLMSVQNPDNSFVDMFSFDFTRLGIKDYLLEYPYLVETGEDIDCSNYNEGDIVYEVLNKSNRGKLDVQGIGIQYGNHELLDISFNSLMDYSGYSPAEQEFVFKDQYLLKIVIDYINNNFKPTEDILIEINKLRVRDLKSFVLLPIVIYILKQFA